MKRMDLNTLVSLTYDSDPKVRKQAAVELSKCDPHQALYPLVQLTYDKDPGVQEVARSMLEELKKRTAGSEPELMSFAEVFSHGAKEEEKAEEPAIEGRKEKLLKPIDQIFEKKLGKEKGEEAKKKMMPTIEKIYMRMLGPSAYEKEKVKGKTHEREKVVQEVLSSYLDALASSAERAAEKGKEEAEEKPPMEEGGALAGEAETAAGKGEALLEKELGVVGKELKPEHGAKEVEESALQDEEAMEEDGELEEAPEEAQGSTIFRFAYDTMMASGGDEKTMQEAMKVMKKTAEDQINLAFKVAKRKYSEVKLTNITELRSGMRNITTGVLFVKSVEHKDYQRTAKKKDTFTRIVVADSESNEGVVYLFEGRGAPITPGMRLKIEKGYAKTFEFSGETGMTVSKKGRVCILL
ncbi:MAG: HEAT repeat domain-containing protein [Candidatus Bilamarchaeaceae archaeon]